MCSTLYTITQDHNMYEMGLLCSGLIIAVIEVL